MAQLNRSGTPSGHLSGQFFFNSKGRDGTGQGSLDPSRCPDGSKWPKKRILIERAKGTPQFGAHRAVHGDGEILFFHRTTKALVDQDSDIYFCVDRALRCSIQSIWLAQNSDPVGNDP